MSSCAVEIDRLTLMIERLVDAELLRDEDAAALLELATAARQSLAARHSEAALRNVERIASLVEALIESGTLAVVNARAVIETVGGILSRESH